MKNNGDMTFIFNAAIHHLFDIVAFAGILLSCIFLYDDFKSIGYIDWLVVLFSTIFACCCLFIFISRIRSISLIDNSIYFKCFHKEYIFAFDDIKVIKVFINRPGFLTRFTIWHKDRLFLRRFLFYGFIPGLISRDHKLINNLKKFTKVEIRIL
jgi:hypothetical protein